MKGPAVPLDNLPTGTTIVKMKDLPTPTSQWRRSIYLANQRVGGFPYPTVTLLSVFDQPILITNCTKRRRSAVVLQSLTLLNDTFVLEQAAHFAERLTHEAEPDAKDRIELAFRIALGRKPTAVETACSKQFLSEQETSFATASASETTETLSTTRPSSAALSPDRKALSSLCHTLFNFNNFLYVE